MKVPTATAEERCENLVYYPGVLSGFQCTRRFKVERKGTRYCTQHDPVKVKEQQDARHAKYQAKWDAKINAGAERDRKLAAFDDLEKLARTVLTYYFQEWNSEGRCECCNAHKQDDHDYDCLYYLAKEALAKASRKDVNHE